MQRPSALTLPASSPSRASTPAARSLGGSTSLPQLNPSASDHSYSPPSRAGLAEKVRVIESRLSDRRPKTRQRMFAAHSHDTQLLQQMASVLAQRAAHPPDRARGISHAGLVEEGQLYAVCLQEVAGC